MILFYTQTDCCNATQVGAVLENPAVLISYFGLYEDKWPWTIRLWQKLKQARERYDTLFQRTSVAQSGRTRTRRSKQETGCDAHLFRDPRRQRKKNIQKVQASRKAEAK